MCGIVGIYSPPGTEVDKSILTSMIETLLHRGPDGHGVFVNGSVGLGHARLSIIDLAGGAQPMISTDRSLAITFNGEIFNFVELKTELTATGATFHSSSDTEVILEGYRQFGTNFFSRLNGQYAFALFDTRTGALHLARDPLGEKPLYFFRHKKTLIFASETKAIVRYCEQNNIRLSLSTHAVSDFFSLNYVPFNRTMIEGVHALTPGTCLSLSKDGGETLSEISRFSDNSCNRDNSNIFQHFEALVQRSAQIRLRSDVPVGLFLSGGLDSTLTAWAIKNAGVTVTAFIADFAEPGFSEATLATEVCKQFEFPFQRVRIDPTETNLPDTIQKIVYHADTPLADSSSVPLYLLSQATARDVRVVLSGDGGDELFGGYLTYPATLLASKIPAPLRKLIYLLRGLLRVLPRARGKVGLIEMAERFTRCLNLPPSQAHFAWNGMFNEAQKRELLHKDFLLRSADINLNTFSLLADEYDLNLEKPTLKSLLMADRRCYLCNDILEKVDRMTMAHGLEARPILLDPTLVAFSETLTNSELCSGLKGKAFIRKFIGSRMPWYPINARKQGFSIPIHTWFRSSLREFMSDTLASTGARESNVLNHRTVSMLWNQHLSGAKDLGFELWGILTFYLWMESHRSTIAEVSTPAKS